METPSSTIKPLHLKKSIFNIEQTILFAALLYLLFWPPKEFPDWVPYGLLAGVAYLIYKQWTRFSDRSVKMSIDEKGILFTEKNKFFPWQEIAYAYFKDENLSNSITTYFYVFKEMGDLDIENEDRDDLDVNEEDMERFDMESLNYDQKEIEAAIKYYSGGKDLSEEALNELGVGALTGDFENASDNKKILDGLYAKTMSSTFTIFLPVFILGLVMELKFNIRYAIGLSFLLAMVLYLWYNLRAQQKARKQDLFANLDEATWYLLLQSVNLRYTPLLDKLGLAVLLLIGPAILVITYFVTLG